MLNLLKLLSDGRPFLNAFLLCFASAAVAGGDAAGAAADPAAVIAGTEGEGSGDGAAAEVEDGTDGATAGTEGEAAGAEGEGAKPVVAAPQIDGRQVPAAVRKHLADLKATNPALAKEINDYVWGYKNLKADIGKSFPGGLKEAIELKTTVEELTGADSVEQFREEVQEYRNLDQQFIDGDPQFIQTAVQRFPDGFKKLAPAMLDTWAEVDPDGYDRRMAGVIVATLSQNQFGNNLSRAIDYLDMQDPDKTNNVIQKAIGLLTENQKKLEGWNTFAQSKPKAPEVDPNAAKNAQAAKELDQKETSFFIKGVARDFDTHSDTKITAALASLKVGALSPEQRQIFDPLVRRAIADKLAAQPNFSQKYGALIVNRDHAGAFKLLTTRSEEEFLPAVENTFKRLYGTTKFAGQKKATSAAGDKKPTTQAAPQGWVKVAADIDPKQIDRKKTPDAMIAFKKAAYLIDGRRVYWGDKIPT